MQNVAWPTMIVIRDRKIPLKLKNALRETPVMMPGSASGRTNRRLTTSRPKNWVRCTANAAQEPSTRAMAVAPSAACTESHSDDRTLSSFHVDGNHLVVSPGMGQLWMIDVLNA